MGFRIKELVASVLNSRNQDSHTQEGNGRK
jgi:hypothetical protein